MNRTEIENQLPGTLDWQLTRFAFHYPESQQGSRSFGGFAVRRLKGTLPKQAVRTWVGSNETRILKLVLDLFP